MEEFWSLYSYLRRPAVLPYSSEYHLFKTGVRPIWEDPVNVHGGKWILRLRKGSGTVHWESLLLAIIGGEFGDDLGEEIVGAVISVRPQADIISLWTRQGSNGSVNLKIRNIMRNVLGMPQATVEYKVHSDSLKEDAGKAQALPAGAVSAGDKPHRPRGGGYRRGRMHSNDPTESKN